MFGRKRQTSMLRIAPYVWNFPVFSRETEPKHQGSYIW